MLSLESIREGTTLWAVYDDGGKVQEVCCTGDQGIFRSPIAFLGKGSWFLEAWLIKFSRLHIFKGCSRSSPALAHSGIF
jgi:hypothetical protein